MYPGATFEELLDYAKSNGLKVVERSLRRSRGLYLPGPRAIILRRGMSHRVARSVLAHELGHAHHNDSLVSTRTEARAWHHAARLLIDPYDYAEAEYLNDGHAGGIAAHLDVTIDVVHAFRERLPARNRI